MKKLLQLMTALFALVAIAASAYTVPNQADLLFGINTDSFTAGDGLPTGNWTAVAPAAGVFNIIGTPTVEVRNGVKWEKNVANGTGYYNAWTWTSPVAVNGITAIAAVKPFRAKNDRNWTPIIDVMFGAFRLGVRNDDGRVIVERKVLGQAYSTATIPNGQSVVISAVVQADGSYVVYTNGVSIMTGGTVSGGFTSLSNGTRRLVCIGTSQDDQSATFNGNIGDVYMWTLVLADADRQQMENDLMTKFHVSASNTPKTITASVTGTGGSISPAGVTTVQYEADQNYIITKNVGYSLSLTVDGSAVTVPAMDMYTATAALTHYKVRSVTANTTIDAAFAPLPTHVVSGTVTAPAGAGTAVVFKQGPSALPSFTVLTATDGTYSQAVPQGTWYVSASRDGYMMAANQTVVVADADIAGINFALTAARTIPQMQNLLFAADPGSITVADGAVITTWPAYYPVGVSLTGQSSPTLKKLSGLNYVRTTRVNNDTSRGFRYATYTYDPEVPNYLDCNGATISAVVQPIRLPSDPNNERDIVVDVFAKNLELGVDNSDGQVYVRRNNVEYRSTGTIPDGQTTLLSLVVQPDGSFTVYARAWQTSPTKGFGAATTILTSSQTSSFVKFQPSMFNAGENYINVGRQDNQYDGHAFNGYINDVFVYRTALSSTDLATLETDINNKLVNVPTFNITASSGPNGSISPAGVTAVGSGDSQVYTITPVFGYSIADVLVDGASVGPVSTYTFSNVTATHTISVTFAAKPTYAVSGKVVKQSDNSPIAGAKVYVSTTANASASPVAVLTTDAGGNYSINLFDGTWYLCASATGFTTSPDATALVAAAGVVLPDFALVASGKNIPQMNQLLFSVYGTSLGVNGGTTTAWPYEHPKGLTMPVAGQPQLTSLDGLQWEQNRYATADGYVAPQITSTIPVNGLTAVAVVQPQGDGVNGGNRGEIIDVMYNRVFLGLRGTDGAIRVARNGSEATGPVVPNGQKTVLTMVIQPDGTYLVYANGLPVMTNTTTSAMTSLDPNWNGGLGFWSYLSVGRNQPDGWTAFQGNIGMASLWKTALSPLDRIAYETELGNTFGIAMPVYHMITNLTGTVAGGNIGPAGITPVLDGANQNYVITANIGYKISDILVDGASLGAAPYVSPYTNSFTGVTAAHSISATFAVVPQHTISGKVTDANGPVAGATVYFSLTPNAFVAPADTATTDASGNYSKSLYEASYYVSAGMTGYYAAADQTVNLTANTTGIDFTLVSSTRVIPSQADLWFSVVTDSLPNSGSTGDWATYLPAGTTLTRNGAPTVTMIGNRKWEHNTYSSGDGFRHPDYTDPVAINGASIVTAVRPIRGTAGDWNAVVSFFHTKLVLTIENESGEVCIWRNGARFNTGVNLPENESTVLALVIQPTGQIALYTNGLPAWSSTATSDMTSLVPGAGAHEKSVWVGRGWDGWSIYNGDLGDVFVYKKALSEIDRNTLERDLGTKFNVVIPELFVVSGKVTLEDTITPVAGVTVSAAGTTATTYTATSAADGTYSLVVPQDLYSITGAKAGYVQANEAFTGNVSSPVTYNITMKPANRVVGTVKDSSGNPIPNAIVQVVGWEGTGPAAVTGADGKYVIVGVDPNVLNNPVSLYADALGFADNTISVDIMNAGSSIITQDVVLTAKAETDYSYGQNGGFEIIDPATGKPAGWHEWSGTNMWNYNTGLGDQFIASTSVAGEFYSGTKGAKYTPLGTQQYCFLGQQVPVIEGSTYNLYWKMKGDAGINSAFPFAEFRNATGNDVGQAIFIQYGGTYPTEWTQYPTDLTKGVRVTIPPGAAYITLLVGCIDPWGGKSVYVDDVVIDRVGPAAPVLNVTLPVPTIVNGKATFDIPNTVSGKTYTLQYKDDLSAGTWNDLSGTGTGGGTDGNLQLQDPTSPAPGARFYRLSVQ